MCLASVTSDGDFAYVQIGCGHVLEGQDACFVVRDHNGQALCLFRG